MILTSPSGRSSRFFPLAAAVVASLVASLALASFAAAQTAEGSFERTLKVAGPVQLNIRSGFASRPAPATPSGLRRGFGPTIPGSRAM
jgi:hypothetical protein